MRLTLLELIEQLKATTNPVTQWSLRVIIVDRLVRRDFDPIKEDQ